MVRVPFFIVDAFTRDAFGGNPAGVFVLDETPPDETLRRLCLELPLESACVLPPTVPGVDFRLRYFVKTHAVAASGKPFDLAAAVVEVPLCGHATVGAMAALHQSGRIPIEKTGETPPALRVQTNIGVLDVELLPGLETGAARVRLRQNPPAFGPPLTGDLLAAIERAVGAECAENLPAQVVSTGTPWLLVPVAGRAPVDNAPADLDAIDRLSRQMGTFGAYVFAIERDAQNRPQTWGRCFAPVAGLNEDPVTGSASGALGGYLAQHSVLPVPNTAGDESVFTAWQGFAGGRGGTVEIGVSRDGNGGGWSVRVTGEAVVTAEGVFALRETNAGGVNFEL